MCYLMALYTSLLVLKHYCPNIQAGPVTDSEQGLRENFVLNNFLKL